MDKMERKYGRYAIPNLTKYLVFAMLIGYLLQVIGAPLQSKFGFSIINLFAFDASKILHFQIWRLVSWVLMPPRSNSILMLIFLLCLISMGQVLESCIGTFRMNVYIFGGILLSDIGGILVYLFGHNYFSLLSSAGGISLPYLTSYYILLSMFMLLALYLPDATVSLYFVLPISMKWMLVIYIVDLGYELITYFRAGIWIGFGLGAVIIFALLNLFIFYYFTKVHVNRKQKERMKQFQEQVQMQQQMQSQKQVRLPKHKCTICGRTEVDSPDLVFRYCSKCVGTHAYCQEHLFTHEHIQ